MNLDQVANIIRENQTFLLTTHTHPDGDGMGCELALATILKKLGKTVYVLNSDPTPDRYVKYLSGVETQELPSKVDCLVVLDASDYPRMGRIQYKIQGIFTKVIYIDHHVSNSCRDESHWVDTGASATAEMIFKLATHFHLWNREIASGIYLGLITDTNWFKNSRTTGICHHIAEQCLKAGVIPTEIYADIYAQNSTEWMHFLGTLLQRISYHSDHRTAYVTIPRELRDQFKINVEDVYSIIEFLMNIANVDIGIVFREENDGKIRVSLRSKDTHTVLPIAEKLGGGGHREAAGALLNCPMQVAVDQVLAIL